MPTPQITHDDAKTPSTPSGNRKQKTCTPAASLLTDASNVYGLNSFSGALVADIPPESFHNKWPGKCYARLVANETDVRSAQPQPLTACSQSPTAHVCPALTQGIWTPPIMLSGVFYARRLIVLVQVTVVGYGTRAVPMIVDTASPSTWLSTTALEYFEHPSNTEHVAVEISGLQFQAVIVKPDVENQLLCGLNILGMDVIEAVMLSGANTRSFETIFVDAFNEQEPPAPKRARLTGAASPALPAAEDDHDHDVLRKFFGVDLHAFELIDHVLARVVGRSLSAPTFDMVRGAIERLLQE